MEIPCIIAGVSFISAIVLILLWRQIMRIWDGSEYESRSEEDSRPWSTEKDIKRRSE